MRLAASSMVSSRLLISRCWDSAMPISLSSLRRCSNCSVEAMMKPLLDTDCAYLVHIGDALQDFLHAVLLQGMHAVFKTDSQQLGDARMFLDRLLDSIGADQEFVQNDAPAIDGAGAFFAAARLIQRELPLVIREQLDPFFVERLGRGSRVLQIGRA